MKKFVAENSIAKCIEYFRQTEYSKPEQIGLFLYFKAAGANEYGYVEYKKWGDFDTTERERYLRNLYDLAGVFDAKVESGLKRTALFPFSITRDYSSNCFYNGGSVFKTLGSRISDTLDNALISTMLMRNPQNEGLIKYRPEYIRYLSERLLKGHRIPLTKIAAWCFRNWDIDVPQNTTSSDLTKLLIVLFLRNYHISVNEFSSLFTFDKIELEFADNGISGKKLRDLLAFNHYESRPEISDERTECFSPYKSVGIELASKILSDISGVDFEQYIMEFLSQNDKKIIEASAWAEKTEIEKKILQCWEKKEFEYVDVAPLYSEFNARFGKAAIESLSGKELLYTLFGRVEDNSLVYNLEHVKKFSYFGGVGGFRTIYTLYQKGADWKYCTNAKKVSTISEDKAIEIATDYRDKFVSLFNEIDRMLSQGDFDTLDGFSVLHSTVKSILGDTLNNRNWVWKYLHMVFPQLFMNVFSSEWQHKLFRVAQIIPENNYTLRCGQFSLFAKKLQIENVYLYKILVALDDEEVEEPDIVVDDEEEEVDMDIECEFPDALPRVSKVLPLNFILYGAPGTGKTYATAEYAMAIVEKRKVDLRQKDTHERSALMAKYKDAIKAGRITFTTFHQSYGYEDFIQGLRPNTQNGGFNFEPVDGVFKRIADDAIRHGDQDYVIIIDEINRANISKVFGELITLIEEDKRWGEVNALSVTLPSGEPFAVPNNLFIIGTMNSADKSISLIDAALRRRFEFIEVVPNASLVTNDVLRTVLTRLNDELYSELDSTDLLVGHAYFMGKTENDLCDIMNHSIIPLLYEYFYDNSNKVKNILEKAIAGYNYQVSSAKVGRLKLTVKG